MKDKVKVKKKTTSVAASPFNRVKLSLGCILLLILPYWFAVDLITPNFNTQLLLLAAYGIISACILYRQTNLVIKNK